MEKLRTIAGFYIEVVERDDGTFIGRIRDQGGRVVDRTKPYKIRSAVLRGARSQIRNWGHTPNSM